MRTNPHIAARSVVSELQKHVLVDGFKVVIDLQKSRGNRIVDAAAGRELLDLYGFYGSLPIGFNHPRFSEPEVRDRLAEAARIKVANPDVYTTHLAEFVQTFTQVAGLPPLERYFFIDGGTLAVENALKAAMDWKVRKNLAAGKGERGTEILHFKKAFHGRSGYTLSLTNTDPRKTDYFAKFPWPRVGAPSIDFGLPDPLRTEDVILREREAEEEIVRILATRGEDIAAIIIEPIQGEGGDNHFRPQWFKALRRICDEHDVLLIFDEVQTGLGTTGKTWCCQHFDIVPDLIAFGKKVQVCGVMAGPRLDEIPENVFRLSSRINSTWGGNLADMVRSTYILQIIEDEHLVQNAANCGAQLLQALSDWAEDEPMVTAVRGRGFMLAFDLPDGETRDRFYKGLFELGMVAIKSGARSIRFRPVLDFPEEDIPAVLRILKQQAKRMSPPAVSKRKRQTVPAK